MDTNLTRAALDTSVAILQRQRKLEQELHAANAQLRVLVQDKEALLKEVHHRVKNNLQVITSLLRLEAGRADPTSRNIQTVLQDMQARIRSMALLHESLYRAGHFDRLNLDGYLQQLCQQAFRAMSNAHGMVRLALDLAPLSVPLEVAHPAGLLVNELISNCLKHAFPQGRRGLVRVSLQPVPPATVDGSDGPWRLSVSDDGVGLSADFATLRTQSLGLQLVEDLARQMHGTLDIQTQSAPSCGTVFTVIFTSQRGLQPL